MAAPTDNYEYLVQDMPPMEAEDLQTRVNEMGAQGYRIAFVAPRGSGVRIVYERVVPKVTSETSSE